MNQTAERKVVKFQLPNDPTTPTELARIYARQLQPESLRSRWKWRPLSLLIGIGLGIAFSEIFWKLLDYLAKGD